MWSVYKDVAHTQRCVSYLKGDVSHQTPQTQVLVIAERAGCCTQWAAKA